VPSTATPTVGAFTVALSGTHSITSSGTGPGEASGAPAVQFTLTFTNKSGTPVSIDSNSVTVTDANGANAWSEDSPDNGDDAPANGTVAVGQSISGKYVFVVPMPERGQTGLKILIYVSTGTSSPQPIMATVN
jgi:hypothetical protein